MSGKRSSLTRKSFRATWQAMWTFNHGLVARLSKMIRLSMWNSLIMASPVPLIWFNIMGSNSSWERSRMVKFFQVLMLSIENTEFNMHFSIKASQFLRQYFSAQISLFLGRTSTLCSSWTVESSQTSTYQALALKSASKLMLRWSKFLLNFTNSITN